MSPTPQIDPATGLPIDPNTGQPIQAAPGTGGQTSGNAYTPFQQNAGVQFNGTSNPVAAAQNTRGMVQQRGDQLEGENETLGQQGAAQTAGYQGFLDPIEQQMASGQGGYTADEAAGIEGKTGPNGLDNLPTSSDQLQSNFLTGDEQNAIRGDTASYTDYFNPNAMNSELNSSQSNAAQTAQGLASNLTNAIDPSQLKQSNTYTDATGKQVQQNQNTFNATLGGEANNVRGAIDPAALKQDSGAAQTEVMTPEQEAQIVTSAGISAGTQNQAAVGTLQRQALAAGSSPMGVAAYRARMNQQSAAQAGDAMTQARVAAQQARAGEALSSEQQREGAQQNLTNVQTGTELNMGQQAIAGEQQLGQQALTQQNTQEAQREAAQQYLTGAQMQAATTGGEAELQNAQTATQQQQQQNQYNATTGTSVAEAQDAANSARAATVAGNRQTTNEGNQNTAFGQGNTVNQEGSARATTVANQQQQQQNVGLGLQAGQEQMTNSNAQGAYGRQEQGYQTQTGGENSATSNQINAAGIPTTTDKVVGALTGAAGAVASTAASTGYLADGGVVTEPTEAVVGEAGPEKIVPVGGQYRARLSRMAAAKPKTLGRRIYGEVA